jgi:hypothetical protein
LKEKMFFLFAVLFLMASMGTPATLYAVEEFAEVFSEEGDEGSDPSAFEGDSDSMPGERAPENMPMDDAPVEGAVGIGF